MSVLAFPALLAALGFGSLGIVAGSIAAKLMSWIAIFYGGAVPAGSIFAILQSFGKYFYL